MASIPNYSQQMIAVSPSDPIPAQQPMQVTQESSMVFGAYNVNNPALMFTYEAIGSLLKQGMGLYGDLVELGYKSQKQKAELRYDAAKEDYRARQATIADNPKAHVEALAKLLGISPADLLEKLAGAAP